MSASCISCTVCKEVFKDSDSIYTTNCGHVFHYICLNRWKSRSSVCPQCRQHTTQTHPLYLNFEEIEDYKKIICELKEKLKKSEEIVNQNSLKLKNKVAKIQNLKKTIIEKQNKIDDIQRLYNISEEWRAEFQDKIENITKENEKLKQKQSEDFTEANLKKDNLGNGITNKTENEYQQIISKITAENIKLNKTVKECEKLQMDLKCNNEILEQRLKHLTLELKQQISANNDQTTDNLHSPNLMQEQSKSEIINFSRVSNTSIESLKKNKTLSAKQSPKFELAQPNDSKIIIKDFPKNLLCDSLIPTVTSLASKMGILLNDHDILNVSTIEYKEPSINISIMVEFKTIDTKIEFLSRRHRLRQHSSTRFVQIKEYIDEKIYPIFMYANRNLRSNGYEYVCCKNNKVYAKKSVNDTTEIAIEDKNHVDRLLGHTNITYRLARSNTRSKVKPAMLRTHRTRYAFNSYIGSYESVSPQNSICDPWENDAFW